jgi:putative SOS response-associated peptidase YedK
MDHQKRQPSQAPEAQLTLHGMRSASGLEHLRLTPLPLAGLLYSVCNLYKMKRTVAEVADWFGASPDPGANFAAEVYPGYPGLVVADGVVRSMNWGFPRVLRGKQGQALKPRPVTNARDDNLSSPFWRDSFERHRCLIPVTQWAEPQGEPGQMTRTWYNPSEMDLFAIAGLWRWSEEWGEVYTMVMADASAEMIEVHDRMPVILRPEEHAQWTEGSTADAFALVRTWQEPLDVELTTERWAGPR